MKAYCTSQIPFYNIRAIIFWLVAWCNTNWRESCKYSGLPGRTCREQYKVWSEQTCDGHDVGFLTIFPPSNFGKTLNLKRCNTSLMEDHKNKNVSVSCNNISLLTNIFITHMFKPLAPH